MASIAKISSVIIIFSATLIFGIIPFGLLHILERKIKRKKLDSIIKQMNCFVGGIFFGTCLLHLLVEAREQIEKGFKGLNIEMSYPVTEVLLAGGFFIVLFAENFVRRCQKRNLKKRSYKLADANGNTATRDINSEERNSQDRTSHLQVNGSFKNKLSYSKNSENDISTNQCTCQETITRNDSDNHISEDPTANGKSGISKIRSFLLVIALSFHMIFEGLALGFQLNETEIWTLMGILLIHKCIVAFSVGLRITTTMSKTKYKLLLMFCFSLISPIGIIIGLAVIEIEKKNDIVRDIIAGIMQGVAAGTFLFVTFFEILFEEIYETVSFRKTFIVLIGFGAVAGLKYLEPED